MNYENCPEPRFLRLPHVMHRVGISQTHIYTLMKSGHFPRSFRLHGRTVAWLESEVATWMAERVRTAH
ncbi:transcriptional regulator, AlpA family [Rhodanobacter sp. OK091]|nr:transcriptional regulator, AlpA family [Rhodanobacter sp. OK091]